MGERELLGLEVEVELGALRGFERSAWNQRWKGWDEVVPLVAVVPVR